MGRSLNSRTGRHLFTGWALAAVLATASCSTQADTTSVGRDLPAEASIQSTAAPEQTTSTTSTIASDVLVVEGVATEDESAAEVAPAESVAEEEVVTDDTNASATESASASDTERTGGADEDTAVDETQIQVTFGPTDPSTGIRALLFEDIRSGNGAEVTIHGISFEGTRSVVSLTGVNRDRELISLNVPRGEMYLIDDLGNRYKIEDQVDDAFLGISQGQTLERELGFVGQVANEATSVTLRINDVDEAGEFLTATIHPEFSFGPYPLIRE